MKIALMYSGAFRNFAEVIDNNIEMFPDCEIDLYFSTWDHMGYSDRINSPDYILGDRVVPANTRVSEALIKSWIPENVNLKRFRIEKYDSEAYKFDLTNGLDNDGLAAQYYKIWDCYKMMDTSQDYDLEVRMRGDVLFNKAPIPFAMKEIVDNGGLLFMDKIWYEHPYDVSKRAINEMFWVGKGDAMREACSIYNATERINGIIDGYEMKDKNYGESICWMNLSGHAIANKVEVFDFDYRVVR